MLLDHCAMDGWMDGVQMNGTIDGSIDILWDGLSWLDKNVVVPK